MNRIITIGREFGSGGREIGKRLAETLKIAYYDSEIVTGIAKKTELAEQYVHQIIEKKPLMFFPITVGKTFYDGVSPLAVEQSNAIYIEQRNIIKEMAEKSDCVIVGRCADDILADMKPLKLFIYSNMESKMERCRQNASVEEKMTDKELEKHILAVDKERARYYQFVTGKKWGERLNYDLCINTSNINPSEAVELILKLLR